MINFIIYRIRIKKLIGCFTHDPIATSSSQNFLQFFSTIIFGSQCNAKSDTQRRVKKIKWEWRSFLFPFARKKDNNKNSKGISIKLKISKMHGREQRDPWYGAKFERGTSLRVIHRFEYVKSKHTLACSVNVRKSRAHNRNLGRAN